MTRNYVFCGKCNKVHACAGIYEDKSVYYNKCSGCSDCNLGGVSPEEAKESKVGLVENTCLPCWDKLPHKKLGGG